MNMRRCFLILMWISLLGCDLTKLFNGTEVNEGSKVSQDVTLTSVLITKEKNVDLVTVAGYTGQIQADGMVKFYVEDKIFGKELTFSLTGSFDRVYSNGYEKSADLKIETRYPSTLRLERGGNVKYYTLAVFPKSSVEINEAVIKAIDNPGIENDILAEINQNTNKIAFKVPEEKLLTIGRVFKVAIKGNFDKAVPSLDEKIDLSRGVVAYLYAGNSSTPDRSYEILLNPQDPIDLASLSSVRFDKAINSTLNGTITFDFSSSANAFTSVINDDLVGTQLIPTLIGNYELVNVNGIPYSNSTFTLGESALITVKTATDEKSYGLNYKLASNLKITSFIFEKTENPGLDRNYECIINESSGQISVAMPQSIYNVVKNNLKPKIVHTYDHLSNIPNSYVTPQSITAYGLGNDVSTKTYIVTVSQYTEGQVPALTQTRVLRTENPSLKSDISFTINGNDIYAVLADDVIDGGLYSLSLTGVYDKIEIDGAAYNGEKLNLGSSHIISLSLGSAKIHKILRTVRKSTLYISTFKLEKTKNPGLDKDYVASVDSQNMTINIAMSGSVYDSVKNNLIPTLTGSFSTIEPNPATGLDFSSAFSMGIKAVESTMIDKAYTVYLNRVEAGEQPSITGISFETTKNASLSSRVIMSPQESGSLFVVYLENETLYSQSLAPTFNGRFDTLLVNGAIYSPATLVQLNKVSEVTARLNGIEKRYTLVFKSRDSIRIEKFKFDMAKNPSLSKDYAGIVDQQARTITVTMDELDFTKRSNLAATTEGFYGSITPIPSTSRDYTSGQTYSLIAGDTATIEKTYTVIVNKRSSTSEAANSPTISGVSFETTKNNELQSNILCYPDSTNNLWTAYVNDNHINGDGLIPTIRGNFTRIKINGVDWTGVEKVNLKTAALVQVALDNVEKNVTIVIKSKSSVMISEFTFLKTLNPGLSKDYRGVIDIMQNSISVMMDDIDFDKRNALKPSITKSVLSSTPSESTTQNFTSPVTYSLTTGDTGTVERVYTVSVNRKDSVTVPKPTVNGITFLTTNNAGLSANISMYKNTTGDIWTAYISDPIINGSGLVPTITGTYTSVKINGVTWTGTEKVPLTSAASLLIDLNGEVVNMSLVFKSKSSINMTSFVLTKAVNPGLDKDYTGLIDNQSGTITIQMPSSVYSSNVTNLRPTITGSFATTTPLTGEAQNFSNPVSYSLTAKDTGTVERVYTASLTSITPDVTPTLTRAFLSSTKNPSLTTDRNATTSVDGKTYYIYLSDSEYYSKTYKLSFEGTYDELRLNGNVYNDTLVSTSSSLAVTLRKGAALNYYSVIFKRISEVRIETFIFEKSKNPSLDRDYVGIIDNNSLTVTLSMPHSTYSNAAGSLNPTISGTFETIAPDTSVKRNFKSPLSYQIFTGATYAPQPIYTIIVHDILSSEKNITSFVFSKTDNPSLLTDVVASVDQSTAQIRAEIPYSVVSSGTMIKPTITLSTGAVITDANTSISPSSNFVYTVTAEDSTTKTYTFIPSIKTSTISFLKLGSPFFLSGTKNSLNSASISTTANTIDISVDSATYDAIASNPIGFNTVELPYNAVYNPAIVLDLYNGKQAPYNVTVKSADQSYSRNFTINLRRSSSNNNTLVSARAYVQEIQRKEVSDILNSNLGAMSYSRFAYTQNNALGVVSGIAPYNSNSRFQYTSIGGQGPMWQQMYDGEANPTSFFAQTYAYQGGMSTYVWSVVGFHNAPMSSNVRQLTTEMINNHNLKTVTEVSHVYENTKYVDIGADQITTYSNVQAYPGKTTEISNNLIDKTYLLRANVTTQTIYNNSSTVPPTTSGTQTHDYNVGEAKLTHVTYKNTQAEYTPKNYYKILKIEFTKPGYSTFENINLDSTKADGYTISGDILTINLKGTFDWSLGKITGQLCTFSIKSETGALKDYTYYLN